MKKIPVHKISNKFNGEVVFLRYISENGDTPEINYVHRDDYYIFQFIEKGYAKLSLDFEELEIKGNSVHCILPGQVHFLVDYKNASGWILAVDSIFVKDEFKEIFEKVSLIKSEAELTNEEIDDLKHCISMLHRRLKPERQFIEQSIINSLLSSYIGIIAEIYQKGFPIATYKRPVIITYQFKSLLSANYKTLKSPSQYAKRMNISAVYLNEVVKKTTGQSVSKCIQNEIILQAKRLLFYTSMDIKEIALELGYEDWAYFTRLFTKVSFVTPSQFRKDRLK